MARLTQRGRRISISESNRRSRAARIAALKRRGKPRKRSSVMKGKIRKRRNSAKGVNRFGVKLSNLRTRGYRPRR